MKESGPTATITVEWGNENHSITVTTSDWAKIKAGRTHSQKGAGYHYEGEFLWDYWTFEGGLDGELKVVYGDDGGQGFVGLLSDADIEEHDCEP